MQIAVLNTQMKPRLSRAEVVPRPHIFYAQANIILLSFELFVFRKCTYDLVAQVLDEFSSFAMPAATMLDN